MLTQTVSRAHHLENHEPVERVHTPSNAESKPIISSKYVATEKSKPAYQAAATKDERDKQLRSASAVDRPLDVFTYGAHPVAGNQIDPIKQVRIPVFDNLLDEREFRKLHHAAALRWLGMNGYNNEGIGGHVTVRDPVNPEHFWINPHAKSFRHILPSDLVLVDHEGVVQPGGNMHAINPAGFSIHLAVHKARPDVIAAVHCHSIPTRAFAALGCELEPINQDACRFYQDHGVYADYGGIVFRNEEGENIAKALGKNKAVILQGHGILTVAKTVDAAVYLFGAMDRCMEAQLLADAAAAGRGTKTIKVSHEEALYSRRAYTDEMEYNRFQSCFEDVVKASNGALPFLSGGERKGFDMFPRAW